jgi:hypothetical protein
LRVAGEQLQCVALLRGETRFRRGGRHQCLRLTSS